MTPPVPQSLELLFNGSVDLPADALAALQRITLCALLRRARRTRRSQRSARAGRPVAHREPHRLAG